jgi:archaellum component FlaC
MEESTAAAIARMEEQIKNLDRRMGNLEKLTESVQSLALSVQQLATQQSSTESDVEALTAEVSEIRDKPAKRWDAIVAALIAGLVGAGIGHFIK